MSRFLVCVIERIMFVLQKYSFGLIYTVPYMSSQIFPFNLTFFLNASTSWYLFPVSTFTQMSLSRIYYLTFPFITFPTTGTLPLVGLSDPTHNAFYLWHPSISILQGFILQDLLLPPSYTWISWLPKLFAICFYILLSTSFIVLYLTIFIK